MLTVSFEDENKRENVREEEYDGFRAAEEFVRVFVDRLGTHLSNWNGTLVESAICIDCRLRR